MSAPDGPSLLAAIHYVRDFHRAAAQLLLASDEVVAPHGWLPHDGSWKCIHGKTKSLRDPDRWMPHVINRQFHHGVKTKGGELLTVSVVPFDPIDNAIEEPLLIASRMRAMTNGNELYWIPLVGMRCKKGLGPLGEVRRVRRSDLAPRAARLRHFEASVEGDELLSLTVSLASITDNEALAGALAPLLSADYTPRTVTA